MNNRITELLKRKKRNILSVYYTAGFPKLDDTAGISVLLEEAGADIIEIGIPFSDPIADGPVIQSSNKIALDNGMTVKKLIEQVSEVRNRVKVPIVLMGYINPIIQYGVKKFCADAAGAGVDGLILPDLPMDEYQNEYQAVFEAHQLSNTFLISPTTSDERIRKIDEATNGFIYAVSSSSTTGVREGFSSVQETYFNKLQAMKLKNPFLIGFGISNKETFSNACKYGAGAIVGSAFISMLNESVDLKADIHSFVKGLKS